MIKRLVTAPKKKLSKAGALVRTKAKKASRTSQLKTSRRACAVDESTLAAEQVFLMYDAAEAKHGKT